MQERDEQAGVEVRVHIPARGSSDAETRRREQPAEHGCAGRLRADTGSPAALPASSWEASVS